MIRFLLYLVGIYMISVGISFVIIYLNLLNIGYSFLDYVYFIIRRSEVLIIIPGIIITFLTIYRKGKKYDIYL